MNSSSPEYYKAWKERLYVFAKNVRPFVYNVSPNNDGKPFTIGAGVTAIFRVRTRRGPHFLQSGFKVNASDSALQDTILTQRNVGGYEIVKDVNLATLCGGPVEQGYSFLAVPWQWIAGEDMLFEITNNGRESDYIITLNGRNIL